MNLVLRLVMGTCCHWESLKTSIPTAVLLTSLAGGKSQASVSEAKGRGRVGYFKSTRSIFRPDGTAVVKRKWKDLPEEADFAKENHQPCEIENTEQAGAYLLRD